MKQIHVSIATEETLIQVVAVNNLEPRTLEDAHEQLP